MWGYRQVGSISAVGADVEAALAAVPQPVVVADLVFVAGVAAVAVGVVLHLHFLG